MLTSTVAVVFRDCVFRNNRGGVLGAIDANITITNCTFVNNTCINYLNCVGGAFGAGANNTNPISVTITDSVFINNAVSLHGGAVYFYGDASSNAIFKMSNTTVADNRGDLPVSVAGGIGVVSSDVQVDSCRFMRNTGGSAGGLAIFNSTSSIITNSRMNFLLEILVN